MATFNGGTSHVAIDFRQAEFWGMDTNLDVTATPIHTGTQFRQVLENGYTGEIRGTSLTYTSDLSGLHEPVSGTVTRMSLSDGSGARVYDFSGFSVTIASLITSPDWTTTLKKILGKNDAITGGDGNDFLYGFDGNDTIEGGAGEDHLYGGAGDDWLKGGIGDGVEVLDDLYGGAGNDTLDGTGGFSIAAYDDATAGITANFATGKVTGNASVGTDTLINISEVFGTMYADTMLGSAGDNYFTGHGGNDVISGGAGRDGLIYDTKVSINLATGKASDGLGGTDTFDGIEDVYGSDFNDTMTGDNGANLLEGAGGNDSLSGGGGNDDLSGGDGNDTLNGGAGADNLEGGLGNDTYYVDNAGDKVAEFTAAIATSGTDLVMSSISYTLGANLENLCLTATGAINGTGNSLNNVIYAGAGLNDIDGAAGTDTLSYVYATSTTSAGVTLNLSVLNAAGQATASGISGADRVKNIENLTGSNYNDTLTGNGGANALNGGAGNDTLDGKAGADVLTGGAGSDTYYVDNAGDKVVETDAVAATGGTDLVIASVSTTLSANVEDLRLSGAGAINGIGNGLNNTIYAGTGANVIDGGGSNDTLSYVHTTSTTTAGVTLNLSVLDASGFAIASGASGTDKIKNIENLTGSNYNDVLSGDAGFNILEGGAGNDTLDGKGGADVLRGGAGNDIYYVRPGDAAVETDAVAATGGIDLVNVSSSYTLQANFENLRLNGSGKIDGTGNALNNVIYAGGGANVIDGAAGTDTLSYAYAASTGTTGAGVTLNLSAVDANAYATASGISGADKVRNIENVAGSNYNDTLTGNGGANTLSGGSGNDTLNGGAGKDVLDGGAGLDTFFFNTALNATTNVDTIKGFVAADDTIRLENAIFTKLAATGSLKAAYFAANASGKAAQADDYIVYETDTGKVFYDADGSGTGAAIHFLTLTGMPAITAADFAVA